MQVSTMASSLPHNHKVQQSWSAFKLWRMTKSLLFLSPFLVTDLGIWASDHRDYGGPVLDLVIPMSLLTFHSMLYQSLSQSLQGTYWCHILSWYWPSVTILLLGVALVRNLISTENEQIHYLFTFLKICMLNDFYL